MCERDRGSMCVCVRESVRERDRDRDRGCLFVCVCVCVWMKRQPERVCVCVCVCEREREGEYLWVCVCVCVKMCVKEKVCLRESKIACKKSSVVKRKKDMLERKKLNYQVLVMHMSNIRGRLEDPISQKYFVTLTNARSKPYKTLFFFIIQFLLLSLTVCKCIHYEMVKLNGDKWKN